MTSWNIEHGPEDGSGATVRQVVAFNLARARKERGLTQEQLGQELEVVTGTKWSRATVSHAESGWGTSPDRVRHFDVNEVAAFAYVLRVPIPWFFLPPPAQPTGYPPSSSEDAWITTRESDNDLAMSSAVLASMALALPEHAPADDLFHPRVQEQFAWFVQSEVDQVRTARFVRRLTELVEEFKGEKS